MEDRQAKDLTLSIENAASIFPVESTASTRNQTGGTGFAAEFAIAAKDTYFSTTPGATCA